MNQHPKTGLVLEGGAMRGLFTAGVIDVMMEQEIVYDGMIGVSAGAAFGCNYKSLQPGRVLRYNTTYCTDPRFGSLRSWIKTGDLYDADFCYKEIPEKLDLFDDVTFNNSPMEFYVVCSNVDTGEPVYKKLDRIEGDAYQWIRASASLPLVSRIVEIEGLRLLDGGITDSIPLQYFQQIGYQKNVVVLTRPAGYKKEPNKMLPLIRLAMRKYPAFVEAVASRHLRYNETLAYITRQEQLGNTFVICPPEPLQVGSSEKDPEKLKKVYQLGRQTMETQIEALKQFLNT